MTTPDQTKNALNMLRWDGLKTSDPDHQKLQARALEQIVDLLVDVLDEQRTSRAEFIARTPMP